MNRNYLLLPVLALFLTYGCKKKDAPTSVNYDGTTVHFTEKKAKNLPWGLGNGVTGASSETDGKSNTDSIVAFFGEGNYPAKICSDLVQDGFDDWYLPSKGEMEAIAALSDDLPGDYTGMYWTSTEKSSDQAYYAFIHYGSQYNQFKNYEYDCLCARRD